MASWSMEELQQSVTQALANLEDVLSAHGASRADVVKTTVFPTSMGDYASMNNIYAGSFTEPRPARSAVAVRALPLGARVEIEAWCIAPVSESLPTD